MSELVLVAVVEAKPGQAAALKAELASLVPPTVKEEGCLSYVLHESRDSDSTFVFLERWESEALLEKHLASDHLVAFQAKAEALVESLTLHKLDAVG